MLRLTAVAVAAALSAVVVRRSAPEISIVLALCGGVFLLLAAVDALENVVRVMNELADTAGLSPALLSPVLKTAGIAILTHVAGAICKDAGESGLSAFLEVTGSAAALVVALPLLQTVLGMVTELL